ncbi:MAG: hypothetical protein IJG99_03490 [Ruminococcus sp.]|nr:hypothetical protein [Ruminococcus sp.]
MTITADFSGGRVATTEPLYQWDTGQKLALSGLPQTASDIQVHFANAAMPQAIVKATELVDSLPTCDIPNEFLQFGSAAKARAWVYFKEGSSKGYTIKTVLIPITPRKRPNDYVSPEDPDSQGIVERAMELLENYQSDLDGKLTVKPIPEGGYDDCTESNTLYYGYAGGYYVYVLQVMVTGSPNQTQYKLRADNALVECRTRHYSNGAWGAWDSWTPVGREGNIADGAITENKLAAALKAVINAKAIVDTTTQTVEYNANNPRIIYTRARVNSKNAIVLTTSDNYYQLAFCYDGTEYTRQLTSGGSTTYNPWLVVKNENTNNKKSEINDSNKSSTEFYPSIKAVVDYLAANYENLSNKLTSADGIDENSTDTEYPTAKAVFDLGVQIVDSVNEDITETNANLSDFKAYIGYTDGDILGLQADFENKVFTRLGAAAGKTAGSDFDAFPMYGQRRRVVVDSDGVIDESISPEDITENDTEYDVMVYQPKFYYKVVPLKLEKQSGGLGYHIRKANYYISATPHAGFKLHPLFYDANGNEIDYVLFSAYEASYMYWHAISPTAGTYEIYHDGVDTDTTIETSAVLKSLPGVKPISGQYKAMNKVNLENCALRKSSNWHLDTIQSVAANQLLIAIEYGTFNTQSAIGLGIVNNSNSNSNNCSSLTGSTSAETFNTASGMASETIYDVAGTETPFNTNGKVAVSYRGMENPWGNIWKHVNGINIWGDGTMNGGQVYIADNFNFNESSHSGNYKSAGFTIANTSGYISAFGYGDEENDWLFMPSETAGNSSLPVGDNLWCTSNLNGYRIALLGGDWANAYYAGDFFWYCSGNVGSMNRNVGGRLLFVPAATV